MEDPANYMHQSSPGSQQMEKPLLLSFEMPNIHRIRESFSSLRDLVEGCLSDTSWLTSLAKTSWLEYCRQLLLAGLTIARLLDDDDKRLVVLHCSDGWDRTTQVATMAQLLLDPFYRTVEGLAVLVEKDWVSFGHQFEERMLTPPNHRHEQQSPIFLQWLFCVAIVVQAAPRRFEYTTEDLGLLADLFLSGWTGSLAFNCESQRRKAEASLNHTSLWALWWSSRENSQYITNLQPFREGKVHLLQPATSLKQMILWSWCLRYDESVLTENQTLSAGWTQSDVVWWLRDDAAPDCNFCKREWAINRRRHHCRKCGLIFCGTCCTKIRPPGAEKTQRICGPCYTRKESATQPQEPLPDIFSWMPRRSAMNFAAPQASFFSAVNSNSPATIPEGNVPSDLDSEASSSVSIGRRSRRQTVY